LKIKFLIYVEYYFKDSQSVKTIFFYLRTDVYKKKEKGSLK